MSEEDVELVRQAYDACNALLRGEIAEEDAEQVAQRFFDPQFEQDWPLGQEWPDQAPHFWGLPELMSFIEQLRSAWVDLAFEPLDFIEAPGDRVLTPIRQTGRGRESGIPIVIHFFQLYTIRDGRLSKAEFFRHRSDALEAAGLSE
jgi:ketosteroid isomerase-like protein